MSRTRAVVFAYHDVGVRCLKTLLSADVAVPLVVTVADDPAETRWFASVADTAADYGLDVVAPATADSAELARRINELQPDFLFSFYYRSMLGAPLLRAARRGALNMHGSLLPRYRGRAPVNWAILRGERECGATLHYMVERADAGDIVDSQAVPILLDDDAREVFAKVTVAAESVLARSLPALIAGTAPRRPQPILPGEYFGRRRPEDGRIDWAMSALAIHNLVRAVAPPFPGAFGDVAGERWQIHRTRLAPGTTAPRGRCLFAVGDKCYLACGDGEALRLLAAVSPRGAVDLRALAGRLPQPLPLS
ncbi:MAG: formyltransferase [Gammaproteobacteria bacterium]|nr:formyltransferase [Gammaproteobacteria bacterium]MBV9317242.1 formyltransferase [Gammaproteobacteria bacterium]MBV9724008.1 formyltransferase [Gammaproteobacteria bacterium]